MGIAFGIGVVAETLARRSGRRWHTLDSLAVLAVMLHLGMVALPDGQGLIQRLMFAIAYAWYAVEAAPSRSGDRIRIKRPPRLPRRSP